MKIITENLKYIDVFPDKAGSLAKRLHIKKDEIPFVRKSYISEKQEIKKKERAVISYISTGIKDRDGEQLLPSGVTLDNYKKNPIVLWAHDYRSMPIGKNIWIKSDDKGLIAKTVFAKNQKADELYKAYSEDIEGTGPLLAGWSVGFIPIDWEDVESKDKSEGPSRIYKKWELLEYSAVPIPSCPEALTLAVEKGLIPDGLKKELEIDIELEDEEIEIEEDDEVVLDPEAERIEKALKEVKEIITKPETTDNYHRIPVDDPAKHKGHKIRTITVSAKQGIKALYCVTCKKIITYMFDVNKWSMEEAQAWVSSYKAVLDRHERILANRQELGIEAYDIDIEIVKQNIREIEKLKEPKYHERWNKSLPKLFDVENAEAPIASWNYALFEKFLNCKVKNIFKNNFLIPSPLLGTYLAGIKEIFSKFKLKDTRNFLWDSREIPPQYEVIRLNSEKSDDFLVDGIRFYDADGMPLILKLNPDYYGISISVITSVDYKDKNKELLEDVHRWIADNNFLKGEKFALSGEFLEKSDDNWDNLILEKERKGAIQKTLKQLITKGREIVGRGLLFIGPPGTGKTKTGRTLINELDSTFIWVSSRDFKYVGPLRALSLSFSLARDLAPTILFIEDVDTWLKDYGGGDSAVVDLVKTEMDGIRQNKGIITIMTSNYPERLPDALLDRPGRFHHIINFELPKKEQRKAMIELWTDDIEDYLLENIVKETDGFSGAHIKELIDFAQIIAEEDGLNIGEALLKSLEKLKEQRELIDEIRQNKKEATAFWRKIKWEKGEIKLIKDKEIELEIETKGVIPYKDLGKAPEGEAWDGPGEVAKADVSDLKLMCAWMDSAKPDIKSSYKLPHHKAQGHSAVWRGVANAAARLPQTNIPSGDIAGCKSHLGKHYKAFGKDIPWEKDVEAWNEYWDLGILFKGKGLTNEQLGKFEKLRKQLFPEEIPANQTERMTVNIRITDLPEFREYQKLIAEQIAELKEGRVLSSKNRTLVKATIETLTSLKEQLEELYNATEPPAKDEEKEIDIEPEKEIKVEKDNKKELVDKALEQALKPEKIQKKIDEAIRLAIKKVQGKVE